MEPLIIPKDTSVDMQTFYRQLFSSAQGSIIKLPAVPTGDELQAGQMGYFGTTLYIITPDGARISIAGGSF
jgi:hypothetical protein